MANNQIRNIEIIDMTGGDGDSLRLNKADLLGLSSSTDTLKVFGNRNDSVDIVGRYTDLGVSGNFHRYKVGSGILLVDTDISDVS